MSLTLGNDARYVALFVGRTALFALMWAVSTLGIAIVVLIFLAAASMPLVGFGVRSSSGEMPTMMIYAGLCIAALLAGRFAAAVVAFSSHKDNARLDNDVKHVGIILIWMLHTILFMAGAALVILVTYGYMYDVAPANGGFESAIQETRYFLLAALIASGVFAAVGLKEDR